MGLAEWARYRVLKSAFRAILDMTKFVMAAGDREANPERTAFANSFSTSSQRVSRICHIPSAPAGRLLRNSGRMTLSGEGDSPSKAAMPGLADRSLWRVTRSTAAREFGCTPYGIQSKLDSWVVIGKKNTCLNRVAKE